MDQKALQAKIQSHLEQQDIAQAIALCNTLIHEGPDPASGYALLGAAYYGQNDLEAALTAFNTSLLHNPGQSLIYQAVAGILVQQAFVEKALAYLLFALHTTNNQAPVQQQIDALLKSRGKTSVKLTFLCAERIGHLAIELNSWLRQKPNFAEEETLYLFLHAEQGANQQLLTMYQRKVALVGAETLFQIMIANPTLLPVSATEKMPLDVFQANFRRVTNHPQDYFEAVYNAESPLSLTTNELQRGQEILREIGVDPEKDWYVCLFVRDDGFLSEKSPSHSAKVWQHRNTILASYRRAIEFIIACGGKVIRVSASSNQRLDFDDPNYIDYTQDHRAKLDGDFMDIYLTMNCRFFIGTASGLCDVALMLDTPTLVTNATVSYPIYGRNVLYIPKLFHHKEAKDFQSFKHFWAELGGKPEQQTLFKAMMSSKFPHHDYVYRDNTESEILAATEEMFARVTGSFDLTEEEQALLQHYQQLFPSDHWLRRIAAPIGLDFLKQHSELF